MALNEDKPRLAEVEGLRIKPYSSNIKGSFQNVLNEIGSVTYIS
jgi:hypothetical protein